VPVNRRVIQRGSSYAVRRKVGERQAAVPQSHPDLAVKGPRLSGVTSKPATQGQGSFSKPATASETLGVIVV